MKQYLSFFLLLTCAFLWNHSAGQTIQGSNILLIIADDMGIDKLASYGQVAGIPIPATPRIDSLSKHGVQFENAWAQSICSPTRASIYTGRQPFDHGVGASVGAPNVRPLQPAAVTIAEVLDLEGYQCGMFGKWHLGTGSQRRPWEQGWDYFSGSLIGDLRDGSDTLGYNKWLRTVFSNGQESDGLTTDYPTKDAADSAIAWIRGQQANSWFAALTFNAPHTPLHVPNANCDGVNLSADLDDVSMYNLMVECMDFHIGRVMDSLKAIDSAMLANTVVIFLGDNGTARLVSEDHPAKVKSSIYLGGIHVPMIIADGASLSGGETRFTEVDSKEAALVHCVDLFATMGRIGNGDVSTGVASRNLAHYLTDAVSGTNRNHIFSQIFADTRDTTEDASLFTGQYKLNYHFNRNKGATCYELFDIIANPEENCNLLDTPGLDPMHFFIARNMRDFMNARYGAWNEGNGGDFPSIGSLAAPLICPDTLFPPDADSCFLSGSKTASLELESPSFNVFPNPNSGAFSLEVVAGNTEALSIQVIDLQGRVLRRVNWEAKEGQMLDFRSFGKGMYMLVIMGGAVLCRHKVIVE